MAITFFVAFGELGIMKSLHNKKPKAACKPHCNNDQIQQLGRYPRPLQLQLFYLQLVIPYRKVAAKVGTDYGDVGKLRFNKLTRDIVRLEPPIRYPKLI